MSAQLQPVTRAVRQIAIRPSTVGPPRPLLPRSLLTLLHSSAREQTPSPLFTIVCALFVKTPGVSPQAFLQLFNLHPCGFSPATPLEATLAADLRVLPRFGRNRLRASPLGATLTDFPPITPLSATLTKIKGRGQPIGVRHECLISRSWPVVTS
jgi:hypothetical protein